MAEFIDKSKNYLKHKGKEIFVEPLESMAVESITDIVTTIGTFLLRSIKGKFQRSISFTVGAEYGDQWIEEALYTILYKYNDIKKADNLIIKASGSNDNGIYYQLSDGTHNLKYKNYKIILYIETKANVANNTGRIRGTKEYTIITYDISPDFVKSFEKDMIANRYLLTKVSSDNPVVSVWQDGHEGDGYTYWSKTMSFNKRKLGTVYLPRAQKELIINTVNEFFANKQFYKDHGIAHNLKILLYGPPGPQPYYEKVITPNGIKTLKEIQPGDSVYNINDEIVKVGAKIEYENLDVYQVSFIDGVTVDVGLDHKFLVGCEEFGNYEDMRELTVEEIMKEPNKYWIKLGKCITYDESFIHSELRNYGIDEMFEFGARIAMILMNHVDTINYNIANYAEYQGTNEDHAPYDSYGRLIEHDIYGKYIRDVEFTSYEKRYAFIHGLIETLPVHVNQPRPEVDDPKNEGIYTIKIVIPHNTVFVPIILEIIRSLGQYAAYELTGPLNMGQIIIKTYKPHNFDIKEFYTVNNHLEDDPKPIFVDITGVRKIAWRDSIYVDMMYCLNLEDDTHQYLTTSYRPTCNSGKDSIAKMIASEWNRNLFYVTGGKHGKFIPNAITDGNDQIINPLFLISDIDKYPFLINEAEISLDNKEDNSEEKMNYKQLFGAMINALDGVLSPEDRIIVMTTNHIEKFSSTFLRPGRIDLMLEIGYITPEVFRRYVYDFFDKIIDKNIKLKNKNTTVAEMNFDVIFCKMSFDEFIKKYTIK